MPTTITYSIPRWYKEDAQESTTVLRLREIIAFTSPLVEEEIQGIHFDLSNMRSEKIIITFKNGAVIWVSTPYHFRMQGKAADRKDENE